VILLKYLLQEICGISTGTLGTILIKLLGDLEINYYMCIISQIRSTCSKPVTVLKEYRAYFVRGRPLDLEREDTPLLNGQHASLRESERKGRKKGKTPRAKERQLRSSCHE